jgi:neutral ceramidase
LTKDADRAKNKESAYEAMDVQGQIVGVEVIQTANRITRMSPVASIDAAERVVSCATKPPSAGRGDAGRGGGPQQFQQPPPVPAMDLRLMLIRVNQIAITGVSGEVVTNIYYHLKKDSPLTNTIMVTMANDRLGYIADDANWERITNGSLARGCAETAIVNNLVGMMLGSIK